MIVLRIKKYIDKLFARRDPMPSESEQFIADPEVEKIYGPLKTTIVKSDTYVKNFKSLMPTAQERVKKLEQDIKDDYIYSDGPAGGDTHFLSDYSYNTGKKRSHFLSKKINTEDRLNYRVYPPRVETVNGKDVYTRKIVLSTCESHKVNGKPDNY